MTTSIIVVCGDITHFDGDCIVNAANNSLCGGGGVDGAIHRASGPELLKECRKLGRCDTGDVRLTRGYQIPVKGIIHAVGPVWKGGDKGESGLLSSCYRKSLDACLINGFKSVAFPNISCGAYGFPPQLACEIAFSTVKKWCSDNEGALEKVVFVCFEERLFKIMENLVAGK